MTVNELIEALQALSDDERALPVMFDDDEFGPQRVVNVYVSTRDRWVELEGRHWSEGT